VTRKILALLAVAVVLLGGPLATPALADFHVLRSEPAAGATVNQYVTLVAITFDQDVNDVASTVQVTGPDGTHNAGVLTVKGGATVDQPIARLSAGVYSVNWTASAGPGMPSTSGRFSFTVATANEPSGGFGQWLVLVPMAGLAGFLGLVLIRRRVDRRAQGI
jgi:methionine-rich copper-binding protein CopC